MARLNTLLFLCVELVLPFTYCLLLEEGSTGEITPPLTTHILDTSKGIPAANVSVTLFQGAIELHNSFTDGNGRLGLINGSRLKQGVNYRLSFDTGTYFKLQNLETFFPFIDTSYLQLVTRYRYEVLEGQLLWSPPPIPLLQLVGYSTCRPKANNGTSPTSTSTRTRFSYTNTISVLLCFVLLYLV